MPSSRVALKLVPLAWVLVLSWGPFAHALPSASTPEPQSPEPVPEPREAYACTFEVAPAEVLLRVVDVRGQPIPGARVAQGPATSWGPPRFSEDGPVTDARGEARLALRPGPDLRASVDVMAEGYAPMRASLGVAAGEQRRMDVKLWKPVSISGRVLDARGRPLPGAKVWGSKGHDHGVSAESDAKGRFTVTGIPEGWVTLSVTLSGQFIAQTRVVAPRRDVELRGAFSALDVQVLDAQGQPLPDVPVNIETVPATGFLAPVMKTDVKGRAEQAVLPVTRVRATAFWNRESFGWQTSGEVSLVAGKRHSLVLSFEGSSLRPPLTGRVVDTAGRPIAGADVMATPLAHRDPGIVRDSPESPAQFERSQTRSDAQGRFTLKDLRAGAVRVRAWHRYTLFQDVPPVQVAPGQDEVTVVLERQRAVEGRVVDPEGRPVSNFQVNDRSFSDAQGQFYDVPVPEGRTTLTFWAEGFAAELRVVDVPAGKRGRLREPIVLQRGRRVSGRVVKEDGCTPIAGAVVSLDHADAPESGVRDFVSTLTDADGRFQLGSLGEEPLFLRVAKREASIFSSALIPLVRVPVGAEEDAVTVRFTPEVSLTGVVKDNQGRPMGEAWLHADCALFPIPLDAAGRFAMHGLDGGQPCSLQVSTDDDAGPPLHFFSPRQVMLPARGTLRVELSARSGPASLKVQVPRMDMWLGLLEGEVPMPETWKQYKALRGVLRTDPCEDCRALQRHDKPGEYTFSQLPLGRYTLLVGALRPGLDGMAFVRVPVNLTAPGQTRVEVSATELRHVLELPRRPPTPPETPPSGGCGT
ncbi:carboxypeptidase regulatory-like domain-containing protein [Pyxidicoccus parkwayensis]|uniref:Carboxypeptidase regulatory-like domain-containing protein n=1 Tax=Pyxidicoccus parkwayensis TaxID=2813578 RepID=A0ABX7NWG2_9BACT|nr:carboxypeptidase regulatory-like domain-containing protein [Pyxidicoccus parkwaysis]QSQ23204.1 carboxypeptidase regulatory-like domain-containing protein [Pyxidicoccus parkwaysis]